MTTPNMQCTGASWERAEAYGRLEKREGKETTEEKRLTVNGRDSTATHGRRKGHGGSAEKASWRRLRS